MKEKFAFRRRGAGCLMKGGTSVAVPADVTNHWQEVEPDVDWMLRGGNAAEECLSILIHFPSASSENDIRSTMKLVKEGKTEK